MKGAIAMARRHDENRCIERRLAAVANKQQAMKLRIERLLSRTKEILSHFELNRRQQV